MSIGNKHFKNNLIVL